MRVFATSFEVAHLSPPKPELSVGTVVRLGMEADFARVEVRNELSTFLSGLAQVEESGHIGGMPGVVLVENCLLNRGHWEAVGLFGVVIWRRRPVGRIDDGSV